jgi:hypothetical protein
VVTAEKQVSIPTGFQEQTQARCFSLFNNLPFLFSRLTLQPKSWQLGAGAESTHYYK